MEIIDFYIENLKHPFVAVILGLVLWFLIKWSWFRDDDSKNYNFWDDQKDEMFISLVVGLTFLIFDDEIIAGYHDLMEDGSDQTELKFYYYLIIGPAAERIYKTKSMYRASRSIILKMLAKFIKSEEKRGKL